MQRARESRRLLNMDDSEPTNTSGGEGGIEVVDPFQNFLSTAFVPPSSESGEPELQSRGTKKKKRRPIRNAVSQACFEHDLVKVIVHTLFRIPLMFQTHHIAESIQIPRIVDEEHISVDDPFQKFLKTNYLPLWSSDDGKSQPQRKKCHLTSCVSTFI